VVSYKLDKVDLGIGTHKLDKVDLGIGTHKLDKVDLGIGTHLKAYPPDRRLCVFTVLKEYLYRTKLLHKDSSKLLISYVKPHKDVSRDTVLHRSGIDTKIYGAHSVRAASTSRARLKAIP
jgi:hypothetical protein